MGLEKNSCLSCGKRGGLSAVKAFGKEKIPGSFCKKCSFFIPDKQSKFVNVSCGGCKKEIGKVSLLIDVILDGRLVHKGETPKQIMCSGCSEKRVRANEHDVDEVLTRHAVLCASGCGTQLAWLDHPEGDDADLSAPHHCDGCIKKANQIAENKLALDALSSKV